MSSAEIVRAAAQDTTHQKAFFDENGYLVVPNILSTGELRQIREVTDRIIEQARSLRESNDIFTLERIDRSDGAVIKRVFDPITLDDFYMDMVRHPRIIEVITALLGPNVQFHHSKAHLKQPHYGSEVVWHQDFPFFPHTNYDMAAVMIAIDESTEENGCLRVAPGSHRWHVDDHSLNDDGFFSLTEDEILNRPGAHIEHVCVPAGGISVHHCLTLHSSLPNRSEKPRRSLIYEYRAADAIQLGGRTDHAGYGMLVAGENPHRVRMVAAEFGLPESSTDPREYARDGKS